MSGLAISNPRVKIKISNFTDLVAWQEAHRVVLFIYKIITKFPAEEKYGLGNQMRRAVISVTSNIAEGFARVGAKDKKRYYNMAFTSLLELENQVIASKDLYFIQQEEFLKFEEMCLNVRKLLSGLIKSASRL
ncbi:MAG: hypothetical protein QG585_507 [Patescibacteria group bacterium]|jgi:four helix bundle protein|nr:hypothetical protein [Patescibacteria group bacterium]